MAAHVGRGRRPISFRKLCCAAGGGRGSCKPCEAHATNEPFGYCFAEDGNFCRHENLGCILSRRSDGRAKPPFFGKREPEPFQRHTPCQWFEHARPGSAPRWQRQRRFTGQKPQASSVGDSSGSKLTVGPNIKLKGVEITDCDTLVVEGTVEATMDSRVIHISENSAFKGSAEIDIAEIHGEFNGTLTVRHKLVIYSTGKVNGKIRYGKLGGGRGRQLAGEIEASIGAARASAAPAVVRAEPAAMAA